MIFRFSLFVLGLLFFSCVSTQNQPAAVETNSDSEIEAKKAIAKQMLDAGHLPGRIIYSDLAGDCEYTIQLVGGGKEFHYVDPVNLQENFRRDNLTVWVKFNSLRRMNRCEKAAPVEILVIQNRDE